MLYFVTENTPKFENAQIILQEFSIPLKQKSLPLVEIQSHSLEEIAKEKAKQAYAVLKKPLVVKDDGWYITALKGFPGSYIKYVNEWFGTNDYLQLLKPYKNKEVFFKDALCYFDGKTYKTFTCSIAGKIVEKPKGHSVPLCMISTFRKDGKTMAECINEKIHFADSGISVWYEFANWYKRQ